MPILLLVNKKPVPPCLCTSGAHGPRRFPPHWSGRDIKQALGRDVYDADLVDFTIVPDDLQYGGKKGRSWVSRLLFWRM